jgi:hypothetical protein
MILQLEFAIIVLTLGSLVSAVLPWTSNTTSLSLAAAAAALVVAHLVSFYFRWQMIPAYSVLAFLLAALLLGWELGRIPSLIGAGVGTLLLALSAALATGLPVRTLPSPDGRYDVGVVTLMRDYVPGRGTSGDPAPKRRLLLKVWYPAMIGQEAVVLRETLWSEFNDRTRFSAIERFFAHYLKNMTTHSHLAAPKAPDGTDRPVLIYNHALLSIASENTLLMEALASHGYVIISVRHEDQRAEYAALQNALPDAERAREAETFKKLGDKEMTRSERAALSLQVYRNSLTLPSIVARRAADTGYVLDNLPSILGGIPGCEDVNCAVGRQAGLVGLSLGGAVATEFCKSDRRCAAVVNLDGGIFGTDIDAPVKAPYLMLYSERNEGGNDFLKKASGVTFEEHTFQGADHLNFHDASVALPGLKWIGLLGPIDGKRMTREQNRRIREFMDKVL